MSHLMDNGWLEYWRALRSVFLPDGDKPRPIKINKRATKIWNRTIKRNPYRPDAKTGHIGLFAVMKKID